MTELIAQLTELGLTRNAALAWLTLLREAGQEGLTGYEVAASGGIPRSAVYNVMRSLESSGAAFSTGESPARYVPTDASRFLAELRSQHAAKVARLDEALSNLPKLARPEPVWILHDYNQVLARIDTMIRDARERVYLSLWNRELLVLAPALRTLEDRGLHCVLYSPDQVPGPPAAFSSWVDDVVGDPPKAAWSHRGIVVVDRKQALIGGNEPDADNQAVLTTNPSLVTMATDHIVLDITRLAGLQGRDCTDVVATMMSPHLG
ncbi:MAG: TrmB family transcriptional regulator [Proteobacteria bacterium]|nr:TrmB family transcriptional regulator [Pseudomonadota bacterium]